MIESDRDKRLHAMPPMDIEYPSQADIDAAARRPQRRPGPEKGFMPVFIVCCGVAVLLLAWIFVWP